MNYFKYGLCLMFLHVVLAKISDIDITNVVWPVFCLIFFVLVIIIFGTCLLICLKKKLKSKIQSSNTDIRTDSEINSNRILNYELNAIDSQLIELDKYNKNKWEISRDKLKFDEQILSSGVFGFVHKAEIVGLTDTNTSTTVTVKVAQPNTDLVYVTALASELNIMSNLDSHLNIINLLGAYTENINQRELIIVYEYCRFGNLHDYLLKQRDSFVNQLDDVSDDCLKYNVKIISNEIQFIYDDKLVADIVEPEWRSKYCGNYENLKPTSTCSSDLLSWSFQIAKGMEYLASKNICHCDLALRNIVLAEDNIVKICDIQFAKSMNNSANFKQNSTQDIFPIKWMAIESLYYRIFSTQSDVWAFGIVLWEMFSLATTPYPTIQNRKMLLSTLLKGYRMEKPKYANFKTYNIMLDCWKTNPMERPLFTDLSNCLSDVLQNIKKSDYIEMNKEEIGSTMYMEMLPASANLYYSTMSCNYSNILSNISEPTLPVAYCNPVYYNL